MSAHRDNFIVTMIGMRARSNEECAIDVFDLGVVDDYVLARVLGEDPADGVTDGRDVGNGVWQ